MKRLVLANYNRPFVLEEYTPGVLNESSIKIKTAYAGMSYT